MVRLQSHGIARVYCIGTKACLPCHRAAWRVIKLCITCDLAICMHTGRLATGGKLGLCTHTHLNPLYLASASGML